MLYPVSFGIFLLIFQKGEEEQEVNLFIFNNWSKDSAVPKTSDSMLQLVKDVDTKARKAGTEPTILVHCL